MEQTKTCSTCGIEKPITEFYKQKDHLYGVTHLCKGCFNKYCIDRWIQRKINAVNYKGGKCEKCGLELVNSHYSVFEFHHLDKSKKDCSWDKLRLKSDDSIRKELDKCIVVCANCHRLIHAEDKI